jgi:hypothetical protein
MRDRFKDSSYWERFILEDQRLRIKRYHKLDNNLIAVDRINIVKQSMVWGYLRIVIAKYSAGYKVDDLEEDLLKAINLTHESWVDGAWKLLYKGKRLNQYTLSGYDVMLWMLSLGYLLDVKEKDFIKLVNVIDRDGVKDLLFEFIINAKLKNRKAIEKESYEYGWILFGKIRQAISEKDKAVSVDLVKVYVRKDWYKEHRNEGWYNSHKNVHDSYFGYWSFETAAVVKILNLDDSSFIDCQYYPKDLVHE